MILDLAVVQWEDTTNIAEWSTPAEVKEFAKSGSWLVENVGWIVYEDNDCIVLAARRTTDNAHFGLYERIPQRAIVNRHDIVVRT